MSRPHRPLAPLNDFERHVLIEYTVAGVVTPLTSATITGFLATSHGSDATTADAALSATLTYIGGAGGIPSGTWQFLLDAAPLTKALLEPLFAGLGKAYLIVQSTNNIRRWWPIEYRNSFEGETEP